MPAGSTRPPAPLVSAVAPERALDAERAVEQRMRGELGRHAKAEIDERGLVLDAPGRRAVVGGAGDQPDGCTVAHALDRRLERRAHIADITAQRQQRLS